MTSVKNPGLGFFIYIFWRGIRHKHLMLKIVISNQEPRVIGWTQSEGVDIRISGLTSIFTGCSSDSTLSGNKRIHAPSSKCA